MLLPCLPFNALWTITIFYDLINIDQIIEESLCTVVKKEPL